MDFNIFVFNKFNKLFLKVFRVIIGVHYLLNITVVIFWVIKFKISVYVYVNSFLTKYYSFANYIELK